ncbi:cilia- and flagella-associated protein 57 A-like [Palaemon carinicauda]|uniref:cilia- and flagella-associated protein 57 A-like n=1 Tax=Palaemon carinicauda TaxID=392227 RepID=UPI0035B669EC
MYFIFCKDMELADIQAKKFEMDCMTAMNVLKNQTCQSKDVKRATMRLADMHNIALKEYQSLVRVDIKRKLSEELARLKEKYKETDKAHHKELEDFYIAFLKEITSKSNIFVETVEKLENEGLLDDEARTHELAVQHDKILALKVELEETEATRSQEFSEIKMTNDAELEKLRDQITKYQQCQSSSAVAKMDLISSKLQAVRRRYDPKLSQLELEVTDKKRRMLP